MILALLAAAGLAYWMWRRGELAWLNINYLLAGAAALAGIWVLLRGELLAVPLLLGVAGYWYAGRKKPIRFSRTPRPSATMRIDEARRVLDGPASADAETIRSAHRRLVNRVHPDRGGSSDLAARVNMARDTLLAELDRPQRR
jgi:hypothetical protein